MLKKVIDLSTPLEKNDGEIAEYRIKQIQHSEGGDIFGRKFAFSKKKTFKKTLNSILDFFNAKKRISRKTFPDNEFINLDVITASTHTGTHIDAPFHFGSRSEGKKAMTIDEIPIEWCFNDGVLLDLSEKKPADFILPEDIEKALIKINYTLKDNDIVLIKTGASKYWGKKEYLFKYPGMSKEATKFIVDKGVKIIGIDCYGFDRPFSSMIKDFRKTGDNSYLWPAHFYGREKSYCHIERLTNLDKLSKPYGFKIACFPIKIANAGAAWTRVVAIL
jgi:kynurenine formamidase